MTINGKKFDKVKSFDDIEKQWSFDEVLRALKKYEQQLEYRTDYNQRPETVAKRKAYHKRRNMILAKAAQAIKEGKITLDELEG